MLVPGLSPAYSIKIFKLTFHNLTSPILDLAYSILIPPRTPSEDGKACLKFFYIITTHFNCSRNKCVVPIFIEIVYKMTVKETNTSIHFVRTLVTYSLPLTQNKYPYLMKKKCYQYMFQVYFTVSLINSIIGSPDIPQNNTEHFLC